MFRTCKAICSVAIIVSASCGCSSDDENRAPTEAQAQVDWCQAACNYTARCIQAVPASCAASLNSQNHGFLVSVNVEFLEAFADCLRNLPCAADWSSATTTCSKKAAPGIAASPAVIAMCKAKAAMFFNCNWVDADLTACTEDYAPMADSAAERLAACPTSTCDDLKTCNQAAFGG